MNKKSLPRNVKDLSTEQLAEILKKKKECNAKALQIVQTLCEKQVSDVWLLNHLQFIAPEHFDDIVTERSIALICGYSLCSEILKDIPKQQFKISLTKKAVYDITERKKFCSNQCYKCSEYLRNQLLTSPLWFRESEKIPEFKLMKREVKLEGSIVIDGVERSRHQAEVHRPSFASVESSGVPDRFKLCEVLKKSEQEFSIKEERHEKIVDRISKGIETETTLSESRKSDLAKPNETDSQPLPESDELEADNILRNLRRDEEDLKSTEFCKGESKPQRSKEPPAVKSDVASGLGNISKSIKPDGSSSVLNENNMDTKHKQLQPNLQNEDLKTTEFYKDVSKPQRSKEPPASKSDGDVLGNISKSIKPEGSIFVLNENKVDTKHKKLQANLQNQKEERSIPAVPFPLSVENSVNDWFSVSTLLYLFGEEKARSLLKEHETILEPILQSKDFMAPYHKKYNDMAALFSLLKLDEDQETKELKPLPDYKIIKAESEMLNIKVKAFYSGQTNFEAPTTSFTTAKEEDASDTYTLPLVDSHAQMALRRRVLNDRLNRILPDLCLGLDLGDLIQVADVRDLVKSFLLSPQNILFKPREWDLVALIIIKLLSVKYPNLHQQLILETTRKRTILILMSYDLPTDYLDNLIEWLTDPHRILEKLQTSSCD